MPAANRSVRVVLKGSDTFVGNVEVADTMWRRGVGLLGRTELEPWTGMMLSPCVQIHTWFMRFPIDAVFLDSDMNVVRVFERLSPFQIAFGGFSARSVLELPAGTAARVGLRRGAVVSMVRA